MTRVIGRVDAAHRIRRQAGQGREGGKRLPVDIFGQHRTEDGLVELAVSGPWGDLLGIGS